MRGQHRVNRRTFIRDMGKGVLGISVAGWSLTACSDSTPATSEPTQTAETTAATTTTAAAATATTSPTTVGTTATTAGTATGGVDIRRVDLGFVSAYVLVRGSEAAIVDTGVGGSAGAIEQGLAEAGLGWGNVGNVILTHRHPDHVGSLGDVAAAAGQAVLGSGAADAAVISSPRPLEAYEDGAEVFGLQIVATPGHTPGHISVYDPATATVVAGDALNGEGSGVEALVDGVGGPNPRYTPEMDLAIESARRLAALKPDTILFGHGAPKTGAAAAALEALLATL